MDPRRTMLVVGASLLVIAGVAATNVVLWYPLGAAAVPREGTQANAAPSGPAGSPVPPGHRLAADAPSLPPLPAPAELPGNHDAVPLHDAGNLSDAAILSVIDEELPDATRLEREVWLEELRGTGPATVRQILRLWRQQHPGETDSRPADEVWTGEAPLHETPANNAPATLPPLPWGETSIFALDADFDREQLISRIGPSLEALGAARDVILNNVTNAGTIGFKRSEVLFGESGLVRQRVCCEDGRGVRVSATFGELAGSGSEISGVRLDMSPGPLQRTRRPLDVAIDGAGFLQVRRGEDLLLTRAGRLMRDSDGRLVVAAPGGPCAVEPPVIVPEEAADVQISRAGMVRIRLAGEECAFEAGCMLVARCADPTSLEPLGSGLFATTAASGPPRTGTPGSDGLGRLRQGVLEGSNVDLEQETAEFRRLQARLDAIAQIVSGAIPFASARPLNMVAAPPDEGELADPALEHAPGLIQEYLELREAGRPEQGPELR
jgi:flagellar basal body rod protein FlgG